MSRQTYENLIEIIKTKLEGISELIEVLAYGESQFSGYPSATIQISAGEGVAKDTARNERIFEFDIDLYQEYSEGGKTKLEATNTMIKAIDKVIEAFDIDNNFGGQVVVVEVIPLRLDTTVRSGVFLFAQFKIRCHDLVNNYN